MCATGVYEYVCGVLCGATCLRVHAPAAVACGYFCSFFFSQDLIRFSSKSETKRHIPMVLTRSSWHMRMWYPSLHDVSGSAGGSGGRIGCVVLCLLSIAVSFGADFHIYMSLANTL